MQLGLLDPTLKILFLLIVPKFVSKWPKTRTVLTILNLVMIVLIGSIGAKGPNVSLPNIDVHFCIQNEIKLFTPLS